MDAIKLAQIAKRAESRKARAKAREIRQWKRMAAASGKAMPVMQPAQARSVGNIPPFSRTTPRSGCGGCAKKTAEFRLKMEARKAKEQAVPPRPTV